MATIPIDWIFIKWNTRLNSLVRLLKLIRILRFQNYWKEMIAYTHIISRHKLIILKYAILAGMTVHIVTCGWYLVMEAQDPAMSIFWCQRQDIWQISIWARYLVGFYWCLTIMVGYGGTLPASFLQAFYSTITVLVGSLMYFIVIGLAGDLAGELNISSSKNKRKMDQITQYMSFRKVPPSLQKKVKDYYTFLFKSKRGIDESELLKDLPTYIRMEVALDINKNLIEKVPLFKDRSKMFISSVVMSLFPCVFLPESIIVRKGDIGREMYFIATGSVEIISDSDPPVVFATLNAGQFFGEIAVVFEQKRGATVRAKTVCDLYILTKDSLDRIAADYPSEFELIKKVAEERLKQMGAPPPPSRQQPKTPRNPNENKEA
jgi:hypothetical protein